VIAIELPELLREPSQPLEYLLAMLLHGRGIEMADEGLVDDAGLGHAGSSRRDLEPPGHIVGQVDPNLGCHGGPGTTHPHNPPSPMASTHSL
jgi:hypothetical protein